MAFNKDSHLTETTFSLNSPAFHWENGDGAQYFSANPITADNGDITLVTMQQLETGQPERHLPGHGWERRTEMPFASSAIDTSGKGLTSRGL